MEDMMKKNYLLRIKTHKTEDVLYNSIATNICGHVAIAANLLLLM